MSARRWEHAKLWLSATFSVAMAGNLVEAIFDPDGEWWGIARIGIALAFILALGYWFMLFVQRRRPTR